MAEPKLMTVEKAWDVIHSWLDKNSPALKKKLNPPASPAAFAKLEKQLGVALPEDFKASYLIHDGCGGISGLVIGVRLMPLADIAKEWKITKQETFKDEDLPASGASFRKGLIKEIATSAKWIPFAGPDEENYVALDLDPGPDGTYGQVINIGMDLFKYETLRYVLAPSFRGFMHFLADQFANDELEVCDFPEFLQTKRRRKDGIKCSLLNGVSMLFGDGS